ncbi:MAG: hypothetical protein DWQ37_21040 [Planctomycetota bacterium]|nr:MAG: hypothetical protein DWQ37_21040 [Planctomycetota bacterium]
MTFLMALMVCAQQSPLFAAQPPDETNPLLRARDAEARFKLVQEDLNTMEKLLEDESPVAARKHQEAIELRCQTLEELASLVRREYLVGKQSCSHYLGILSRQLDAELDRSKTHAQRCEAWQKHVAALTEIERSAEMAAEKDPANRVDLLSARAARVDATIGLQCAQDALHQSKNEIELLRQRTGWFRHSLRMTSELHLLGSRGGESENVAQLGRDLWAALADLALAEGNRQEAAACLRSAVNYSEWYADALSQTEGADDYVRYAEAVGECYLLEVRLSKLEDEKTPKP